MYSMHYLHLRSWGFFCSLSVHNLAQLCSPSEWLIGVILFINNVLVFLLSVYDFFNKSTYYFQLLSYSVIHSFVEFSVIYYIKVVWLMINSGEQLRFQSLAKRHPLNSATRQLSLEQSVQTVKKEMLRRQQCRPTYTCPSSWAMV